MEDILYNLSLRQKTIFLTCLAQLTSDELLDEEMDYIIDIALMCDYPEDKFELIFNPIEENELLDLVKDLSDPLLAKILIRELFYLGYADQELSDDEIVYIMKIADNLKLTIDDVEKISDWVSVGMEWEKLGDELFGKGI